MAPHVTSLRDVRCYEKKMNQSCSTMLEFGFCGSFAKSWHPKSLKVERYIYISISRNADTRKTIFLPVLLSLWFTCQHFHSINHAILLQLQEYFKCEARFNVKIEIECNCCEEVCSYTSVSTTVADIKYSVP
jgi:hypothetical protein